LPILTALAAVVALFLASAATAVVASLTGRRALVAVTKPLTTLLLFPVIGWPRMPVAWWIAVGLLLSLGGDVALLGSTKRAFMVGLVLFLLAHVAYIVGFADATAWATGGTGLPVVPMLVAAIAVGISTALLLRRLWPGAGPLRIPVAIYGVVISVMVVSAVAAVFSRPSLPGSLPLGLGPVAAVGAVLFYVSDAALALNLFHRPFRWAPLLTLGVYWLGQLGIALAARMANG
jgi:alkenylglycerophosphocholine hydrolase